MTDTTPDPTADPAPVVIPDPAATDISDLAWLGLPVLPNRLQDLPGFYGSANFDYRAHRTDV